MTVFFLWFLSLPEANNGVCCSGKRHATPQGAAGAEDNVDPGQHPSAAGGAATDSGAAAEGPGTGHPGRKELDNTGNGSSVCMFCKCRPHLIFNAGYLGCKSVCSDVVMTENDLRPTIVFNLTRQHQKDYYIQTSFVLLSMNPVCLISLVLCSLWLGLT